MGWQGPRAPLGVAAGTAKKVVESFYTPISSVLTTTKKRFGGPFERFFLSVLATDLLATVMLLSHEKYSAMHYKN